MHTRRFKLSLALVATLVLARLLTQSLNPAPNPVERSPIKFTWTPVVLRVGR